MFLTNNSPEISVLTLGIKFRQNNLYLASFPRISANSNEIIEVSRNFRKISGNI